MPPDKYCTTCVRRLLRTPGKVETGNYTNRPTVKIPGSQGSAEHAVRSEEQDFAFPQRVYFYQCKSSEEGFIKYVCEEYILV